ncbi:MAG TPA: hypothetical protein VL961_04700, partial [Acidimicrobiales bacterium]|nr:hypothetical protein [Acidimicrobiales bacterium]
MSIVDPKVGHAESTAANAAVFQQNFAVPAIPEPRAQAERRRFGGRSITDGELALVNVCIDFVCAAIAVPVSLFLLSKMSTAPPNSLRLFSTNAAVDSLFPVAVIASLALGGMYRVTHRRLQPSAFLEMRELSFGVGSGCVLALTVGACLHAAFGTAEPVATQLVAAVIVAIAVITVGRLVTRYFLHSLTSTRVLVVGSGKIADRIML